MKKILWLIAIFIILIVLNIWSLKPSPLDKFPVPRIAKIDRAYDGNSIIYKWNGINTLYRYQVQLNGWRKVEQMGSLVYYSKGDKTVGLIAVNKNISLSRESQ